MTKIKYCQHNKKFGSKSLYKLMKEQFPEIEHKKKDCLGECKSCKHHSIAKIGKSQLLCADSPEELYEELKAILAATRDGQTNVRAI
jgi:uncharacterized protein YuzB (UPF0349 family)